MRKILFFDKIKNKRTKPDTSQRITAIDLVQVINSNSTYLLHIVLWDASGFVRLFYISSKYKIFPYIC